MGICVSMLKMKKNVFPLDIVHQCFMTIHLIRFILNNNILDLQLE
jgi:hypothetical protein